MGRIWFGISLLGILLVLGIGSSSLMERNHLHSAAQLEQAASLSAAGHLPEAEKIVRNVQAQWDDRTAFLSVLADHEPMEEIEGQFAQLETYAVTGDAISYASGCACLSRMLQALGKSHSLDFRNLL